ncbi:probable cytochrome P450 313a5 [Drosophila yakuba]|uniref:Uncharacterized protein n=1 Tax=Drosophila yakuba TaxID=7245 RepID=B4PNP5_DROYA|nr:probable cytochrome P450 313a5 [Drosophila yakuba]EDW97060.1 uncharacterized protein Dyak_GE24537 [Drosophila yakuba]
MLTLQFLEALAIILWMYFLWRRRRFYIMMLQLPGPMGLPFVGLAFDYIRLKRKIRLRTILFKMYGKTVLTWIGITPVLVTCEPKILEDIFMSPHCNNRSSVVDKAISSCLGLGLLTLKDNHWNERRKLLSPSFKNNAVLRFVPVLNIESNYLVTLLGEFVDRGELNLLPELNKWSFKIAAQITMGDEVRNQANYKNGNLLESYKALNNLIPIGVVMPWLRNKYLGKLFSYEKRRIEATTQSNAFIRDIIDKRLSGSTKTSSEPALIDRILHLVRIGDLSYDDVMGEFSNIIFAASDTLSITVNNVLILLAMFPDYQDKVFEELTEVFPSGGAFEVSQASLEKLVQLDQVLHETMRLIPAVPLLIRQTSQDIQLSNGYKIPEGVTIMIDIFHTHRNTDTWGPQANAFNPDNFLPENKRARQPYAYLPFSKGKKTCLGWKLSLISAKLALAKILRNYVLSTTFLYKDLQFIDNTTMKLGVQPSLAVNRRV